MASIWATLDAEKRKEQASIVKKKKFGEIMHDPNVPEWKKQKIVKKMQDLGGYENLPS